MAAWVRNVKTSGVVELGARVARVCLGEGVEFVRWDIIHGFGPALVVNPTQGTYLRVVYTPHPIYQSFETATIVRTSLEGMF